MNQPTSALETYARLPDDGPSDARAASCDDVDLQRLWLGTLRHAWRTLAIIPVDAGVSTYEVARLIATLGMQHGDTVTVADVRAIRMHRVGAFLEAVRELVDRGDRVIFAMRSMTENLAGIPLASAAEGVILCVRFGSTPLKAIEATVEQVGKEHILGSILVREAPAAASPAFVPPTKLLRYP